MSFSLDVEAGIIYQVNKKQISHSLIPILQANSHTPIQHNANVCQLRKSYQNFSVHSTPRLIRLTLGIGFCFPLTSMMIMIVMF